MCYSKQISCQIFALSEEFDLASLLMVTVIMPLNAVIRTMKCLNSGIQRGFYIHLGLVEWKCIIIVMFGCMTNVRSAFLQCNFHMLMPFTLLAFQQCIHLFC